MEDITFILNFDFHIKQIVFQITVQFFNFRSSEKFIMMAGSSSDQNTIAQKTWELANNVESISPVDEIYRYDRKEQQDILAAKPWEKE